MAVDFGKVFGLALRYPFKKDGYFLMFSYALILSLIVWYITGYFIGDLATLQTANLQEIFSPIISWVIFVFPVTAVISLTVGIFLMAMYIDNSEKFFRGKKRPILESYGTAKKMYIPLLLTTLLIAVILLVCFGTGFIPILYFVFNAAQSTYAPLVLGAVLIFVGGIIGLVFIFMTFLAPQICVLENKGPVESIKKSWNLIGKNKANTLLFFVIFSVIYIIIALVSSIPENISSIFIEYPMLSIPSLAFTIFRTIFVSYTSLFVYSSYVNFYLSIKK